MIDDLNNLVNIIKEDSVGDIYTMVCFDMTAVIRKKVSEYNEN